MDDMHVIEGDTLANYRDLVEGLADMVKGGRIRPADIPDDWVWLHETLRVIAELDPA